MYTMPEGTDNIHSFDLLFRGVEITTGGLAIGLERLTSQLLGLRNVREVTLFPRDRDRIAP